MLNVGLESWNRSALQKYMDMAWCCLDRGDRIVGFLMGHKSASATELLLLATDPVHQGQGVARQLMTQWLAEVSKPVWLEVHEANFRAKALYFSLGFQEVGRRPRYYRDGGTAISMSLE
jgi:ribosomal-protein-alanine N-acetyltransferase